MFNLFWIETLLSVLEHPRWPEAIFGNIDKAKAERGRYLYEDAVWANPRGAQSELYCGNPGEPPCNPERIAKANKGYCARCHAPISTKSLPSQASTPLLNPALLPLPNTTCPTNADLWNLPLYRLDVIGTDRYDAVEFWERAQGMNLGTTTFRAAFEQSSLYDKSKANQGFNIATALQFTTTNVMNWWFRSNQPKMEAWVKEGIFTSVEEGQCTMEGFRPNTFRAPRAYPARPMAGYWVTAPYLHNHSVPNLYELLSPVDERTKTFYVGNTEFDPVNLGFVSTIFSRGFKFKTSEDGNSNIGHEFSAQPGDLPKPGVIGPLLSHDDRMAILEYMKVISDVPVLSAPEATRRRTLLEKMKPHFEGKITGVKPYGEFGPSEFAPKYAPTSATEPAAGRK